MKIVLVGGNFDDDGGRKSKIIERVEDQIIEEYDGEVVIFNGGYFEELETNIIMDTIENDDIVLWFPNIPNDKPKIRTDIKKNYPRVMLVTSKLNNSRYTFQELVAHALSIKSNLFVELNLLQNEQIAIGWTGSLYDPLGNCWCRMTDDFAELTSAILKRIFELKDFTRQSAIHINDQVNVPEVPRFFNIIETCADIFHQLVMPAPNANRFLGNASFRCTKGFPSFKCGDFIYVSQRNIDKRCVRRENFVPVIYDSTTHQIKYYGPNKPSVDTPIQVRLYDLFPEVRYMIHSHVYVKDACMTSHMIPCGAIEEVDEIVKTANNNRLNNNFVINLKGHGSLVLTDNLDFFDSVEFMARPVPEVMECINPIDFLKKKFDWLK